MTEETINDDPKSFFTPEQGSALIRLARQAITDRLRPGGTVDGFGEVPVEAPEFKLRRGTFVTLKRKGKLIEV